MTRTKWFLLCFALILLCALILLFIPFLIKSIQLASIPHPPNVPDSWKPHDGGIGIFQVWLPRGWKDVEKGRIGSGSFLHAVGSDKEEYGTINVWNDDSTFGCSHIFVTPKIVSGRSVAAGKRSPFSSLNFSTANSRV